jgi:hypothetical protein
MKQNARGVIVFFETKKELNDYYESVNFKSLEIDPLIMTEEIEKK